MTHYSELNAPVIEMPFANTLSIDKETTTILLKQEAKFIIYDTYDNDVMVNWTVFRKSHILRLKNSERKCECHAKCDHPMYLCDEMGYSIISFGPFLSYEQFNLFMDSIACSLHCDEHERELFACINRDAELKLNLKKKTTPKKKI